MDGYALAAAVIFNPGLLNAVPELRNIEIYGPAYDLIRAAGDRYLLDAMNGRSAKRQPLPERAVEMIREVLSNYTGKKPML
jgi:hypothetical protein